MNLYVLDRFYEEYAVLTSGDEVLKIPVDKLPRGAVEGSVLRLVKGSFVLDNQEYSRRISKAKRFIDNLKNR